ncbi:MAG: hypothetical protein ACFFCF_06125 [Promethearchaeota archaeon]
MKFYSEDKMKQIREEFEDEILQHPHLSTNKMFGCPCYKADEKLFAILVTDSVVLTRLSEDEQVDAYNAPGAKSFESDQRMMKKWVQLPIKDKASLEKVMPWVMKSYQNALALRSK